MEQGVVRLGREEINVKWPGSNQLSLLSVQKSAATCTIECAKRFPIFRRLNHLINKSLNKPLCCPDMADLLETLRCCRIVVADSVWVKLLSSAKELAEMLSKVQKWLTQSKPWPGVCRQPLFLLDLHLETLQVQRKPTAWLMSASKVNRSKRVEWPKLCVCTFLNTTVDVSENSRNM